MIIYADDTTFFENRNSGQEFVGIGCLILDDDMTPIIIQEALVNLRNDTDDYPSRKVQDERTLANNFFHACDDSPNAHSHICTSINSKLVGNFQYSYTKNTTKDKAWEQCLQYLAVLLTSQNSSPIQFHIEQRTSVSESIIRKNFKYVSRMINMGSYEHYAIPKYYPKLEISIGNKLSSGIQIVDFITWAKNRSHFKKPDTTWEKRLKFSSKSSAGVFGDDIYQGDIVFGRGVRESILDVYPKEAFPLEESWTNDELLKLYQDVINIVIHFNFHDYDLKEQFRHIWDDFSNFRQSLLTLNGLISSSLIEEISNCYLTLFDSLPIYKDIPKCDFLTYKKLLKTKRLCALTLRNELIHGVRTKQHLAKVFRGPIKI